MLDARAEGHINQREEIALKNQGLVRLKRLDETSNMRTVCVVTQRTTPKVLWRTDLHQGAVWFIADARKNGATCALLRVGNCSPAIKGAAVDAAERALRSGTVSLITACSDDRGLAFLVTASSQAGVNALSSRIKWAVQDAGLGVGISYADETTEPQEAAVALVTDAGAAASLSNAGEIVTGSKKDLSVAHAIASGEIEAWYQGIHNLRTMTMEGLTVLPRWDAGNDVSIAPSYIWEMADNDGVSMELRSYLFEKAVEDTVDFRGRGGKLHLPVTVSYLESPHCSEQLLHATRKADAQQLVIELVETDEILTPNGSSTLRLFVSLGFELSLLGFGSGTNNIDRLVSHNWRHVSLSPAITASPENPSLYAVARNTVTLLAEYGARIGISGVEEETSYNHLLPYGLHSGRGNQFSRIGPSRIAS